MGHLPKTNTDNEPWTMFWDKNDQNVNRKIEQAISEKESNFKNSGHIIQLFFLKSILYIFVKIVFQFSMYQGSRSM